MENFCIEFMRKQKKRKEKYLKGGAGEGLSIMNVKFSISAAGYMRKKDRYKEIFVEKPKYLYVKCDCMGYGKKWNKL
jgi:hypothetical protein